MTRALGPAGDVIGIDLYERYNPVTDWTALARGIAWGWLKATDGTGRAAIPADRYVEGFRRMGRPWGLYHFAQPGDPEEQAHTFIAEHRRLGWVADDYHIIPALDMERGTIPLTERVSFARTFLEVMHRELSVYEALYANTSWLRQLQPDTWPYEWDRTWAAEYGPNDGQPHAIRGYTGRVDAHQFTSKGTMAGVQGWVDLSRCVSLAPLLCSENLLITETTEDTDMPGVTLIPTVTPIRFSMALPGPAQDPGTRLYMTTGWGGTATVTVFYLGEPDPVTGAVRYLGPEGGDGHVFTVHSDLPGWAPVPDGTVAIQGEYVTAQPGSLAIDFVRKSRA